MKTSILLLATAMLAVDANAQLQALNALKASAQNLNTTATSLRTLPATTAGAGISLLADAASSSGQNHVVVQVGMRTLSGDMDSVTMYYRDPSPSGDNGTATVFVDGSSNVVGFLAYYEREAENASFQIGLDGFAGSVFSIGVFLGGSYHLVNKDGFKVKTGARIGYGIAKKKLGEIENNGLYFYVDGKYIYNPRMGITYNDQYVSLSPNITLEKHIVGPIGILASVAGNFGFRSKATVTFQGEGFNVLALASADPIEVDMKDANLVLTRNNERVDNLGIRYTGISLNLGLSYTF